MPSNLCFHPRESHVLKIFLDELCTELDNLYTLVCLFLSALFVEKEWLLSTLSRIAIRKLTETLGSIRKYSEVLEVIGSCVATKPCQKVFQDGGPALQ